MKQNHQRIPLDQIENIVIYRSDSEWAALYINGRLDTGPGDAYLCDERIRELLNVLVIDDDSFVRGSSDSGDVCETVEEIEEYENDRLLKLEQAARLKAEIAEMENRVRQLDPQGRLA